MREERGGARRVGKKGMRNEKASVSRRNREKANVWEEQKSSLVALCAQQRIDLRTVYDSVPIKLREKKMEKDR